MTTQLPPDIRKKALSLSLYLHETKNQLLNIIAYIEGIRKNFLFYALSQKQGLSRPRAQEIFREMREWPNELFTRTERLRHDFQTEKEVLGTAGTVNIDMETSPPHLVLHPVLNEMNFLFTQLIESTNERSLRHLQEKIAALQQEPSSKTALTAVQEALETIHSLFNRLLNLVYIEEKDLLREENVLSQIEGNTFIERHKDTLLDAVRSLFQKRYLLQQHLDRKYEPFPDATITARVWKEQVNNHPRTVLIITLLMEGKISKPSWEARGRYDAEKNSFEVVFGERKGFEYTPQEQKKYSFREQFLREMPAHFIQYIFNSQIMKQKR